jgi:hypothetical protein
VDGFSSGFGLFPYVLAASGVQKHQSCLWVAVLRSRFFHERPLLSMNERKEVGLRILSQDSSSQKTGDMASLRHAQSFTAPES